VLALQNICRHPAEFYIRPVDFESRSCIIFIGSAKPRPVLATVSPLAAPVTSTKTVFVVVPAPFLFWERR
jgi:hypothetical protein